MFKKKYLIHKGENLIHLETMKIKHTKIEKDSNVDT